MSENQDNTNTSVMAFGLAFLLIFWAIHHFLGDQILAGHLALRQGWLTLVTSIFGETDRWALANQRLLAYDPREWTLEKLAWMSEAVRVPMFIVLGGVFAAYAWRTVRKNPVPHHRTRHNRESLARALVGQWPWIAPVLPLDLINTPIDKGRWAMAHSPLNFARKYRLVENGQSLRRDRAEKLFALQLGRLWEGTGRLSRSERALYLCFAAQACGEPAAAERGLRALVEGMVPAEGQLDDVSDHVDYSVFKSLEAYGENPTIRALTKKHAYVSTVLCALLVAARSYGVLPPNYFIWLRPRNRLLWYTLNSLGRRTPFAEVAGAHAHYLAEQVAGHAVERPYVVEAVNALEKALSEIKMEPAS